MIELANNRWFPLVNCFLATGAAVLWFFTSGRLGWPLVVVIVVPWLLRILAGRSPYRRSGFNSLLWLFGLTAVFGTLTAYNSSLAVGKFWIMVGAIAVYFAIISLSRRDVWLIAAATGPVGALLAIYFALSNSWQQWPAEIDLFNQAGAAWTAIRPSFPWRGLHPNTMAGLMALLLPFTLAFMLYAWKKRKIWWVRLASFSGGLTMVGLIFTSALGAWLALSVGLGFWLIWAISGRLGQKIPLPKRYIFGGLILLLILTGLPIFRLAIRSGIGQADGANRLNLARQTLFLIGDFSLTGSGLGTFPALYAHYVQVTPSLFAAYSNLFFDIWLEQGFLALVAMLVLLAGCFWLLLRQAIFPGERRPKKPGGGSARLVKKTAKYRRRNRLNGRDLVPFRWAAFVSLVVMVLHGLLDDALFGGLASPLLFFAPAMVIVVTRRGNNTPKTKASATSGRLLARGGGAAAFLVVGLFLGLHQTAMAQWYANLGALEMARVELADWPTNQWDRGANLGRFDVAAALFEKALALDEHNRTAHHRLGLIAMLGRDYQTAVYHLEQAAAVSESYRGVVKSLGYSYVWLSQFEKASQVLTAIPEARKEMSVYSAWWERQNRPDLATRASKMNSILENITLSHP